MTLILGACAVLPALERPRVTIAGLDDLDVRGFEMRLTVKLRVDNPNAISIDYEGVEVRLDVQGRTVARGLNADRGSIPARGSAIVALPVTISLAEVGRHAMRIFQGRADSLDYLLEGKLDSPLFGATRFRKEGQLALPGVSLR